MEEGPVVSVEAATIVDWPSFHDAFADAFGFPDWYGRNMNAWIDLFSYLDRDDSPTSVSVPSGESLTIRLNGGDDLRRRAPALYEAIVECAAFVNRRRIEGGGAAYLSIVSR